MGCSQRERSKGWGWRKDEGAWVEGEEWGRSKRVGRREDERGGLEGEG